jgi:predicted nucleic acid-binding protein
MTSLNDRLNKYVIQHRSQGILLDTNVLLLLLFFIYQPDKIGKKRLEKYGESDGELLAGYIKQFSRVLTTQHVLAETNNLLRQIVNGQLSLDLSKKIHPLFCLNQQGSFEQCVVEGECLDIELFSQLGLTDSALAAVVQTKKLLLADDLDLYLATTLRGGDAINFTHMREAAGIV